jgi:hypothetical protein
MGDALWTTASESYDSFGTETVEVAERNGQQLRRVLVDPDHAIWQGDRYASGSHGSWTEDPRIADRANAERRDRLRLDDERRAALRTAGLGWLANATPDAEIDGAVEADEIGPRGLSYADVKAERKRRQEVRAEAERAATWERCRAAVPDGAILVDEAPTPSRAARRTSTTTCGSWPAPTGAASLISDNYFCR